MASSDLPLHMYLSLLCVCVCVCVCVCKSLEHDLINTLPSAGYASHVSEDSGPEDRSSTPLLSYQVTLPQQLKMFACSGSVLLLTGMCVAQPFTPTGDQLYKPHENWP